MNGEEVYIVEAVRTPVGRGHREKGIFRDVHPAELLGRTFVELLGRAGVDSARVDNAIAGCVYQIGEQSTGITRNAWLGRGLAEETGAITVDIRCGSGQEATHFGALRIAAGRRRPGRHRRGRVDVPGRLPGERGAAGGVRPRASTRSCWTATTCCRRGWRRS